MAKKQAAIYSLTICARLTLDLHNLNSEGGEGNVIQTRQVNVVNSDGELYCVNAISGDMLKHFLGEHLHRRLSGQTEVPLCDGCARLDANRISVDAQFMEYIAGKGVSDAAALDALIVRCAIDDMAGNLVTAPGRSLPRKSVVEFGWAVGIPGAVETDSYFHVKYAVDKSEEQRAEDTAEGRIPLNVKQAIFHRPASSGIYAFIAAVEVARIGFNDNKRQYAIDPDQRRLRYQALMESLTYTFLDPRGAMRGTQRPHFLDMEGVVSLSTGRTPALTVSPLKADYRESMERVRIALDPFHPGAVSVIPFDDMADFATRMGEITHKYSPFELVA